MMPVDDVFKALSDPTRRQLLDHLAERDGQTLSELVARSTLSRYGVMRHLKILEAAGLVVTRQAGRFKHHYLNAVPLQEVIDRWIEPMTKKPLARAVLDLKAALEGPNAMNAETQIKPDFVLETFIRTTPERLWQALTDGTMTPHYYFGTSLETDLTPGGSYAYKDSDGNVILSGEVVAVEPRRRLEMTFTPAWATGASGSRNVYEIESLGDACKLTILHFGLTPEDGNIREGWAKIAAGLKTLLETGEPLALSD